MSQLLAKLRRDPPIAITCECGERRNLRYGERWRCEQCGRTWNTSRIPADQYAAIRRTQSRFRWTATAVFLLAVALITVSILIGRAYGGLVLVAFGGIIWKTALWPRIRRRYMEKVAAVPKWEIKAE